MEKKILLSLLMSILLLSMASAFDWNNGLAGYWTFDESSGNRADSLGLHNLTETGGSVPSVTGVINNGARIGEYASAFLTDGNAFDLIESANWTLSLWARNVSTSTDEQIYSKGYNNQGWNIFFRTYGGVNHRLAFNRPGGGYQDIGIDFAPSDSIYSHIVIQHDASNFNVLMIYLNAVNVINITYIGIPIVTNANNFILGGDMYNGVGGRQEFDEYGIFNRVLNGSEISELYNEGNGLSYGQQITEAFNLTSELISPIDNLAVSSPVTFTADIYLNNTQLTNATLYVWNATDLVLKDTKSESSNVTFTESWTESLNIDSYIWNVKVCNIGNTCVFDEENETFSVVPQIAPHSNLIQGSGTTFDIMNSAGAGLGLLFHYLAFALPMLLIGLGIVGVIILIAISIKVMIKDNIKSGGI